METGGDLLAAARAAGERLAVAEGLLERARADYHHAVRCLHLSGVPLREAAQALGISHQRVQQIVDAGGGSWWSRVWRGRKVRPEMTCSFCGRPAAQVDKLVAGPNLYICDACIAIAAGVLRGDQPPAGAADIRRAPSGTRLRCSFCGKRAEPTVTHENWRACEKCLGICVAIVNSA